MRILSLFEKAYKVKTTGRHTWRLFPQIASLCDEYTQLTYADIEAKGPKYLGSDLMTDYSPDVVIVHGLITAVIPYLQGVTCAKVGIVTDFCYLLSHRDLMNEYVECGIDIMFQRGTYDPGLDYPVSQIYWPFSANPEEFYPGAERRRNKIGFAGSLDNPVYNQRRIAGDALSRAGLVSVCRKCFKGADPDGVYPYFLRSHVAALTSTQMDHVPTSVRLGPPKPADMPPTPRAKTFEMMASATAVLTPPFYMQENIFPGVEDVCFWYKRDCSDILQVAEGVLTDTPRTRRVALAGYRHFLQYHTDAIRIKELYDHLERLVGGRPIERQWGI